MASVAAVLRERGLSPAGLRSREDAIPDSLLRYADVFERRKVYLQFTGAFRKSILLEDVREDVDLHILIQRAGTAFRHRVADLDKKVGDRAFVPMREECGTFNCGSAFGSDEGEIVTPRTCLIELTLAAPGLFGGENAVPDFFRRRGLLGECRYGGSEHRDAE